MLDVVDMREERLDDLGLTSGLDLYFRSPLRLKRGIAKGFGSCLGSSGAMSDLWIDLILSLDLLPNLLVSLGDGTGVL